MSGLPSLSGYAWLALLVGLVTFVFALLKGSDLTGALIAAAIVGILATGLVKIGADKIHQ